MKAMADNGEEMSLCLFGIKMRTIAIARLAVVLMLAFGCSAIRAGQFETAVTPLPEEDIDSACHYKLNILVPEHKIQMVWIIFDRGRDVHDLYADPAVLAFARRFDVGLLLHGHCPGKQPEDHRDMNMEPAKGLGPALLRALDQFAGQTGHRELSSAKMIFLGFSGTGPLCARLVALLPERTVAAVLSSPGHYDPVGIDTVKLDQRMLLVPELIIAGGADSVSGTARPYEYFRKYRRQGAPWAFVIQNGSPHCCTANARDLIILWLEAAVKQRVSGRSQALRQMDRERGWLATFKAEETSVTDSFGLKTFDAAEPAIMRVQRRERETPDAGWLPNRAVARLWLTFVLEPRHPILPLRAGNE
jgi:pimeloyl-ACP methyl ester carboxylesterase